MAVTAVPGETCFVGRCGDAKLAIPHEPRTNGKDGNVVLYGIERPWHVAWDGLVVRRRTWAAALAAANRIASAPSAPRPRVYKAR